MTTAAAQYWVAARTFAKRLESELDAAQIELDCTEPGSSSMVRKMGYRDALYDALEWWDYAIREASK